MATVLKRTRRARKRARWSAEWEVPQDYRIDMDAQALATDVAADVLGMLSTSIRSETVASTGRRVGVGYETGLLADDTVMNPGRSGSATRGRATIRAPRKRVRFVTAQGRRGVLFFDASGLVAQRIQRRLEVLVTQALSGVGIARVAKLLGSDARGRRVRRRTLRR